MTSFITSMAEAFSGSTIANYIYGICTWHVLHGLEWAIISLEMEALLKGADCLVPKTSKRKKWQPYTLEFIQRVCNHLQLDNPFDAAIFACLTTCFYAATCLGEFVIPRLDAFYPSQHISPTNLGLTISPGFQNSNSPHLQNQSCPY